VPLKTSATPSSRVPSPPFGTSPEPRGRKDDTKYVVDICRRLDGIPLAIELAAARVPSLGLSQISARLTDRLRVLSRGSRLDSARHQMLRAALDWSYALLDEQERQLLERLSVFAGGWSPEALAPVCGSDMADSDDLIDVLVGLVDKSLVMTDARDGTTRYRLLETIREYASERLDASTQAPVVRRRHAAYFRSLMETGGVRRRGVWYAPDMDLVRREHDNVRAALGALLSLGDFGDGLALCSALAGFWLGQGYLNEADEWLRRFLAHAESMSWLPSPKGCLPPVASPNIAAHSMPRAPTWCEACGLRTRRRPALSATR